MEEAELKERKPSPAKAMVAQSKPRDNTGKFIGAEERAEYESMMQREQIMAEKARMDALLGRGRGVVPQQQPVQRGGFVQQERPVASNFEAILSANKVGGEKDVARWEALLGKKRNNRW